jgi:hypothetical protein
MPLMRPGTSKDRTVDLLQQILRTWLQPAMSPAQFDQMMRDSEYARRQPNHVQVSTRFEVDPINKRMILSCVFTFPEGGKRLIVPPGVKH